MKKFLKFIFSPFLGKRGFQGLFSLTHRLSLKGMNYGGGADYRESGEEWVLRYIRNNYNSNRSHNEAVVIFDVGANEGGYSKLAQKIFKNFQNLKIYSFEPAPKTFTQLQSALSGAPSIYLNNFGFGSKKEQIELYYNQNVTGLSSVHRREIFKSGFEAVKINLETIDEFCTAQGINKINFLKLDIEGHELEALKGAKNFIKAKKIDYIQFEFGGTDIDARVFLKDFFGLLGRDYKIYRILQNGLLLINYDETKEIFTTTNYLAVLK